MYPCGGRRKRGRRRRKREEDTTTSREISLVWKFGLKPSIGRRFLWAMRPETKLLVYLF